MNFSWIAIARGRLDLDQALNSNSYFRVERNSGFLKPLGITSTRAYRPWLVTPYIEVWQEIQRKINQETIGSAYGRSSVLRLKDTDADCEKVYSFTVRLYRPNFICIEVKLKHNIEISLEEAFALRNLDGHISAKNVVDYIIGIINYGSISDYPTSNSFFHKPALFMESHVSEDEFLKWKLENKDLIVGMLINNKNYRFSDPDLADKIFDNNKEVDIKYSKAAFSLISKQGILTSFAAINVFFSKDMRLEHLKRFRFLEHAIVIKEFLRDFPSIRKFDEDVADFLLFLILPYISSRPVLPQTVTGTYAWRILSEEFGFVESLEVMEKSTLAIVESKSAYFQAISQEEFDSLEYNQIIHAEIKPYRKSWLVRDFEGAKIVPWVIGSIIAIVSAFFAALKVINLSQ